MEVLSKQKPTTTTTKTEKKTNRRHRRCNTIQLQPLPQLSGRYRRRLHHYRYYGSVDVDCILTAFWLAILIAMHVCYGDQIERDPNDIDTMGLSQVQFEKHHSSRQVVNIGLTLHDSQLQRDETINGGDEVLIATQSAVAATLVSQPPSSSRSKRAAHVLANRSNRNFKTKTTSAIQSITVATTPPSPTNPNRFNVKRDRHRKVHQSRNLIGNASSPLKPFTQYKYAIDNTSYYVSNSGDGKFLPIQLHKNTVPSSVKPKIQLPAKHFNPSSSSSPSLYDYHRTPSHLSYNLVRDHVQKTHQFQQTTTATTTSASTDHQQSNKSYVYKTYYRPVMKPNRNNCNQCRIIPGVPQRHKPYFPNRVRYVGM